MAYLPTDSNLATQADIHGLETRMDRFEDALDKVNRRLDRFFLTMVTALMGMFATLVARILLV